MRHRAPLAAALLAAFAGALVGLARAQDHAGTDLRLRAYFGASDDAGRVKALAALESEPVPPDADARTRLLRRALARPTRKPSARNAESLTVAGEPLEAFVVTPRGYDAKKLFPAVLALHGRHGSGHEGFQPFALPEEEWEELRRPLDADMQKRGYAPGTYTIKKPEPRVPWEDGLVLAPSYMAKTAQDVSLARVEGACLATLERAARSYALDEDRVVLSGISLGAAIAYQVACRHPDRFAGVLALAGGAPGEALENLRPLQVYVIHGDKDAEVPVAAGREMDARLTESGVTHVYEEVKGLGHEWPKRDVGARVRAWMKARVRTPWPRAIRQRFDAASDARRVFWVELPAGSDAEIEASVKENAVTLSVRGAKAVVLHLGEPLVDLEKEIVVRWGDHEAFRGKLTRSWKELLADLDRNGFDLPRAAPTRVEVKEP